MTNLELTTYALIAGDIDNGNYLDNFVPLLAALFSIKKMSELGTDKDSITKFKNDILEEFKLNIPIQVVKSLIRRCEKKGILEHKHNQGKHVIVEKGRDKYNFLDKRDSVERDLNSLADSLLSFVNKKIVDNKREIELLDRNKSIEILFNVTSRNTILLAEETQAWKISKRYKLYKSYVNQFIIDIKDTNNTLYETLIKVAMGCIISNYLLLPSDEHTPSLQSSCTIFLDTPFLILWLLESNNNNNDTTYQFFIDVIKKEKVSLKIFEHTQQETKEIIENAAKYMGANEFDIHKASRFMKRLQEEGYTKADAILLEERFKNLLKKNEITIERHNNMHYNTDIEAIFEENKSITDYDYYAQTRSKRDIKSLSSIYREQSQPSRLRDIKKLFVTTHRHVYNAHCYQKKILGWNTTLSLCVTDVFLMTILWIKNEKKIDLKSFMQKRFIVDCILLRDKNHMKQFNKLKEALNKNTSTITKEDTLLLLERGFSDAHFFENNSVNEEFRDESLKEMLSRIKEELVAKKNKEIETLQKENENLKKENEKRKEFDERKASKDAKRLSWGITIGIIIVFNLITYYFSSSLKDNFLQAIIHSGITLVLIFIVSIKNWVYKKILNHLRTHR